jgi:hypothetical protein
MAAAEDIHGSVEAIEQVLSYLLTERRQLRSNGGNEAELEANRQAIEAMRWRLGRAAQDEYTAPADPAAASSS